MNQKRWRPLYCLLLLALCLLPCAQAALADTVSTNIQVQLSLTGSAPPNASTFTFVLQPNKVGNPMPAASTLTITGAGSGTFGPITYTQPNDYTYTLYQAAGSVTGYTYDPRVYNVTVQVTSDASGKLTTTVYLRDGSGNKPGMAVFVNRFQINTDIPKTGYGDASKGWQLALLSCIPLAGFWRLRKAH